MEKNDEIKRLANYLLEEYSDERSEGSAVDVAIKILKEYNKKKTVHINSLDRKKLEEKIKKESEFEDMPPNHEFKKIAAALHERILRDARKTIERIENIKKFPKSLSREYVKKDIDKCTGFHESLLRSYHILHYVKGYLKSIENIEHAALLLKDIEYLEE